MKVNMRLFIIGSSLMPIHEGFEPMNGIHEPSFVFANSYQLLLAISIGVFFLIRRYMLYLLPAPIWFIYTDLIAPYVSIGYL